MPTSPLYHHTFTWEGHAEQVIVTGSFDNWSSSLPLRRIRGTDRWEARTTLKWGEKVVYKFVVDSQWLTSPHAPTERDWNGNENNVLLVPNLALPPVTPEAMDHLASQVDALGEEEKQWRTVRLAWWTGSAFALFATLPPSPTLNFHSLRHALLSALVEGGAEALPRSFAFARLSFSGSGWEVVKEEADGEEQVQEGTYVLVGADPVFPLPLKHFPLPTLPSSSPSDDKLDMSTPSLTSSALLTPSPLSRIPRSTTRYFDFDQFDSSTSEGGDDERSYAYSVTGSVSEFSEVEPHDSRSRAASIAYPSGGDEDEENDDDERMDDLDARSDATFNTALSQGWTSSLGFGGGGGAIVGSSSEGWTSGGLPAEVGESSGTEGTEGSGEVLPTRQGSTRLYDLAAGNSGEEEEEVGEAWGEGKVVFLPLLSSASGPASLLPLALHPSAVPSLPLIRPSTALLASLGSNDKNKLHEETFTAHHQQLPTPPASPPTFRQDELAPPCFASSAVDGAAEAGSNLSKEELEKALQEQLERGLGRWVVVHSSQDLETTAEGTEA